ncbi:MAG: hypothetical protein KF826_04285 [Xanthobacteraceae bacterium]|nr:hypothetical protein [Xanthobacteraceae bacterium]
MQLVLTYALAGVLSLFAAYLTAGTSNAFFLFLIGGLGFLAAAAGQYFKVKQGKA